jgi:hypothetical protein
LLSSFYEDDILLFLLDLSRFYAREKQSWIFPHRLLEMANCTYRIGALILKIDVASSLPKTGAFSILFSASLQLDGKTSAIAYLQLLQEILHYNCKSAILQRQFIQQSPTYSL